MKRDWLYLLMLGIFVVGLYWSANGPKQLGIWFYEVSPVVVLVLILLFTYRRFPLTPIAYVIVFFGGMIALIGGHYTYAEVPLFDTLQEMLHSSRNCFDRFGHFFQGLVSAILFREYLFRKSIVQKKGWLSFIVLSISIAIAAIYELVEVLFGLLSTENLQNFLGTQGDIWDSHWDIFSALIGAIIILLLSPWHNHQIRQLLKKNDENKR